MWGVDTDFLPATDPIPTNNMRPPQFSIIIPYKDRAHLLPEAVDSIMGQSVQDFEVIIVNDGPSEVPALPTDRRLRVVKNTSQPGAAGARNIGISVASGTNICFLDDDDLYTPERLLLAEKGLRHSPATACSIEFRSKTNRSIVERTASEGVREFLRSRILSLGQITVRRDLCPRFDERLATSEDHDWVIKVLSFTSIWPIDQVGYIARDHPGTHLSTTRGVQGEIADRMLLLQIHPTFFSKHRDLLAWQWKLLGGRAMEDGDRSFARTAFIRSLLAQPTTAAFVRLMRTFC